MGRRAIVSSLLAGIAAGACGTHGGGQVASKLAEAVVKGATHSSSAPKRHAATGPHCGVWKKHGRTCPVVPKCQRLQTTQDLEVNACERDGRLRALHGCQQPDRASEWCRAGDFPRCDALLGSSCSLDEVVCIHDRPSTGGRSQSLRLLECCVGGALPCEQHTYALVEIPRRDSGVAALDAAGAATPKEAALEAGGP